MSDSAKAVEISDKVFTGPAPRNHTTYYLETGLPSSTTIFFVHGWPELSISWRHQLTTFAGLGFHCVAPDMRGYGKSGLYSTHDAYRMEEIVQDMLELIDHLGKEQVILVGHDWGSPAVGYFVSHHPERTLAAAFLCVPYFSKGFSLKELVPTVDRKIYPEAEFPLGQWDYQKFYEESFEKAESEFNNANPTDLLRALYRAGDPSGAGKPVFTAYITKLGGWFPGGIPAGIPRDDNVMSEEDEPIYLDAIMRSKFFGGHSWYMNHAANTEYASRAVNGGNLDMPVLMIHARYDWVCETVENTKMMEDMRASCANLSEAVVDTGHWCEKEKPMQVNAALARWLAVECPPLWIKDGTKVLRKLGTSM
ncbi:alpha/beta hydrolase fold protein [Gonapodya prolifera JEL478]|uniref:Alpha/beta hydrolase fold protein n=1 Tax=Gonapodya prolifera (strain JEL478) TaxID=1344416 RepID=A0A139A9T8_GONPJ|nr:alpha/beta hydrolase fold protein [Gonapodya prolifera JEL478]|eukprot:KXS13448.1 alpha/beta hydrolase fold protein [Gonapodya prolifera JEL478]